MTLLTPLALKESLERFSNVIQLLLKDELNPNLNTGQENNNINMASNGTLIQPPLHVTLPSFSRWFDLDDIDPIEE